MIIMASKREEYKLAMAENLIVDVLREGNEEKYIDKVRDCLSELQDCYSFKEDDLYHPRISKKAELRESYESLRKASLREHVDYYVMLGDEPKYSTEEQNAADLLGTVTFNRIINGTLYILFMSSASFCPSLVCFCCKWDLSP